MSRGHFQEGGAEYARYRPGYPPALAVALAEAAPSRALAVDVGCGSGQLTALLALHFERVEARDVSAAQIANAPSRPNIRYALGSAEALDVPAGAATLITAAQAAHWFDLPKFFAEARRIAAPGALLALISYGDPKVEGPLAERFDRFYRRALAPFWPPERRHVFTGYAEIDFPFEELSPPALEIERHWPLEALVGYVETWSAAKRARAGGAGEVIENFVEDARRTCAGDDATDSAALRVSWPINMRMGRL